MVQYLLRAEDRRRENPWATSRVCWHVTRPGTPVALCTRRLETATIMLPIQDAECVPYAQRCADCWERAFQEQTLAAS